jgi:hypothetical protein
MVRMPAATGCRTHCRLIETLAHIPGMAFFLGSRLNIAARQIEADA